MQVDVFQTQVPRARMTPEHRKAVLDMLRHPQTAPVLAEILDDAIAEARERYENTTANEFTRGEISALKKLRATLIGTTTP